MEAYDGPVIEIPPDRIYNPPGEAMGETKEQYPTQAKVIYPAESKRRPIRRKKGKAKRG